jgi:hypothetical protein
MCKQYSFLALAVVTMFGLAIPLASPVKAHDIGTGSIDSVEQFPQTRATQVRQTIQFTTANPNIARIKIVFPVGIKISNNIALYNNTTNRSLSPFIHNNSAKDLEIDLPRSLPSHSQITIDLNNVNLWGLARTYYIYSQSVNSADYTYIGSAEFHRY